MEERGALSYQSESKMEASLLLFLCDLILFVSFLFLCHHRERTPQCTKASRGWRTIWLRSRRFDWSTKKERHARPSAKSLYSKTCVTPTSVRASLSSLSPAAVATDQCAVVLRWVTLTVPKRISNHGSIISFLLTPPKENPSSFPSRWKQVDWANLNAPYVCVCVRVCFIRLVDSGGNSRED